MHHLSGFRVVKRHLYIARDILSEVDNQVSGFILKSSAGKPFLLPYRHALVFYQFTFRVFSA